MPNDYGLPRIPELLDDMKDSDWFTKIDLRWGFNNLRIKEGDEWKAAFKTYRGSYEPLVMFFGLRNSPASFQTMMNEIFKPVIDRHESGVYIDDLGIHTKGSFEYHLSVVKECLQILRDHDLYAKPEKCEFFKKEMHFLGFIASKNTIRMDPDKLKAIDSWSEPKTVKQVQSFLGFLNFYRRFIPDFSDLASPLTRLTRKTVPWVWDTPQVNAFNSLKSAFLKNEILVYADPEKPLRIEADSSNYARGAILSMLCDDRK